MKDLTEILKPGDQVWTIQSGWDEVTKIARMGEGQNYSIGLKSKRWYSSTGLIRLTDKHPSLFLEPPAGFDAEPRPCKFAKGQKVLVGHIAQEINTKRYFSHMENGEYYCFNDGKTEWSSQGETNSWAHCEPWEENSNNDTPEPKEEPQPFSPGEVIAVRDSGDPEHYWSFDVFVCYETGATWPYKCEDNDWEIARKLTPAERGETKS